MEMCCYINDVYTLPQSGMDLSSTYVTIEPWCRGNWSAMGGSMFGLTNGTLHCLISTVETDASLAR